MNGGTAVDAGGDVAAGGRPFGRLAIVNRGEPAMRLINAVREWNAEGRPPLRTIALYTAADRRAMFVREADEAVLIGPDTDGGAGAPNPYLDLPELARALRACRAEAVWPGWGFVSERAEFAQLCRDLGIVFVGPSPEVMRALGDKIESKLLAAQVGVPMAEWSGGPVADLAAARAHAEAIGYPLMVKATAGGGGRGIRLVSRPEELDEAFTARRRRGRAHRGRRHGLPRARAARRAARRGAGRRRRHGRRVDARRARLHRAAAQPEGARGVGVRRPRRRAGRAAVRVRRPAGPRGGLRQRRHRRVPLRAGRPSALVPRGQHPAAGGAPGHRGDHRRRHRQAPAARRDGRAAGRYRPGRAAARTGTRSRPG